VAGRAVSVGLRGEQEQGDECGGEEVAGWGPGK
jgi:hypothetical protein